MSIPGLSCCFGEDTKLAVFGRPQLKIEILENLAFGFEKQFASLVMVGRLEEQLQGLGGW
jgi:hypothetical protein